MAARPPYAPDLPLPSVLSHGILLSRNDLNPHQSSNGSSNFVPASTPSREDILQTLDTLLPALAPALYHAGRAVESVELSRHFELQPSNAEWDLNVHENSFILLFHNLASISAAVTHLFALFSSIASSEQEDVIEYRRSCFGTNNAAQLLFDVSDHLHQHLHSPNFMLFQDVQARRSGGHRETEEACESAFISDLTNPCVVTNGTDGYGGSVRTDEMPSTAQQSGFSNMNFRNTLMGCDRGCQRDGSSADGAGVTDGSLLSGHVRNADFVLRAMAYYVHSIIGANNDTVYEEANGKED